ncbi:hypothetical protein ACJMK2_016983 [Sinanodonta woodiana]|uniref:Uncharacterized protein n=1 Tax=Sinanodonta woodiana TaxID=1069815 RepID=A0ABD3UYV5_SINWO
MMREGDLVYPKDGNIYKYDVVNTSDAVPVNLDEVITADGWEKPRLIGAVNGKMPGPAILVYEGQYIVVHVTNNLINEALTIHWHGITQKETPWMDGVPFVTQCPILPGQTFTYRFKAEPSGTHFYHSHVGTQSTMGIFGTLIIRERKKHDMDEHIMTIQDYNHDMDSLMSYMKDVHGLYNGRTPASPPKAIDGTEFDMFEFHSGLINGRGRFYDPETGTHNNAPLECFHVQQGKSYRFRVLAVGIMHPFRVSVDNHSLLIVASDGHGIEPVMAESFIISPGETFDFILVANQIVSNYWVRVETLVAGMNHRTEAILRYDGAIIAEPKTSKKQCTKTDRCLVINCPFSIYPPSHYTDCFTFNEIKGASDNDPPPNIEEGRFEEYFLNFGIPGANPASVNGRVFKRPTVPLLTQPAEWQFPCDEPACGEEKVCQCTNSINIRHGNVVQLVLTNMGIGKGMPHPIHLHGHVFFVMKMGYGKYNRKTGKFYRDNLDINCRGNINREQSYCNNPTWSTTKWRNGNVPDLELDRPPIKDTVVIPSGGYVVIRFLADNPGIWDLHCHMEMHNIEGMRLLVNESLSLAVRPPKGFPECRSFTYPREELNTTEPKDSCMKTADVTGYWVAVMVLSVLLLVISIAFIQQARRNLDCRPCRKQLHEKIQKEKEHFPVEPMLKSNGLK